MFYDVYVVRSMRKTSYDMCVYTYIYIIYNIYIYIYIYMHVLYFLFI